MQLPNPDITTGLADRLVIALRIDGIAKTRRRAREFGISQARVEKFWHTNREAIEQPEPPLAA